MTTAETVRSTNSFDVPDPILELTAVTAGYGRTVVLRDVSLSVPAGTVVALLGANGAGKTTLLRTTSGLLSPSAGKVNIRGRDVTSSPTHRRARAGLCLVPEGRGVFGDLTVRENVRLQRPTWVHDDHSDEVFNAFPVLGERLNQMAGSLSGGEQQMLALARIYMAQPAVVLLDEVSMGLSPIVVDHIFTTLKVLATTGVSMLLVEQYVDQALEMADTVVLLDRGQIISTGPPSALDRDDILQNYLGLEAID